MAPHRQPGLAEPARPSVDSGVRLAIETGVGAAEGPGQGDFRHTVRLPVVRDGLKCSLDIVLQRREGRRRLCRQGAKNSVDSEEYGKQATAAGLSRCSQVRLLDTHASELKPRWDDDDDGEGPEGLEVPCPPGLSKSRLTSTLVDPPSRRASADPAMRRRSRPPFPRAA